jgi:hypothetical protein
MRRILTAAVVAVVAVPALAACSGDGGSGTTPGRTSIDITIKDGGVTPNGSRVRVDVGRALTLHIVADRAGELHVHASPEQEIAFPAGTSTERLTIDRPGIVDVEDHELDQVVVQLQVS